MADNTSSLAELVRFAPHSISSLVLSDNIHACSSLRSSPPSFQSVSRLYYCSALSSFAFLLVSLSLMLLLSSIELRLPSSKPLAYITILLLSSIELRHPSSQPLAYIIAQLYRASPSFQ